MKPPVVGIQTPGMLLAVFWLASGMPAGAQTLKGTVVDSESGEPVTLAYVGLLGEGGELTVAGLARGDGSFALAAPTAGAYFLYVARTGYETLMEGVFELGEAGVLELQVGLKPTPIALDPLIVEGERRVSPLESAGFYERAALGRGHFMIREEIERVAVERISDALRNVPRISLLESRPLVGSPAVMRSPAVAFRLGGDQCSPTLYVDRTMVATGVNGPVRPDEFVSPGDVEAIEVYARSTEVPVTFDAINDCGVIVIWTRMH
jgi:hypothetical protein